MKKGTITPGIYGDWLMVAKSGAIERREVMCGKGQEFIEMIGSSRSKKPGGKEIKKIIESWAIPASKSPEAKEKLSLVEDGCFVVYFSNGDGETFMSKYICQTNQ